MVLEHDTHSQLYRRGLVKLLEIKDSDVRIGSLRQGAEAVDRGIHLGGAFSATIPLVSLFYSGAMRFDVQDPTRPGQDLFVLSKGHAVASMATIFADLGYFDSSVLKNSRAVDSILNGHPGPVLPGVHIATGPLGQGVAVAQGYAMALQESPQAKVFCITGDGELQEGVAWEALMHAPSKRLDNFCVIVDKNEGQLDTFDKLIFQMQNLPGQIESFGWRVISVDGESYASVLGAIDTFLHEPADGRPTAIVANTRKGYGAFGYGLNKHKITLSESLYAQELPLQQRRRDGRVADFLAFRERLEKAGREGVVRDLDAAASRMNLTVDVKKDGVVAGTPKVKLKRVKPRDKKIQYDESALPALPMDATEGCNKVVEAAMKVFAQDPRVVSVDSDLGTTSGLDQGIRQVDQDRGINVGVAESNMMCIGEAYATLGYNAWVSTFCPFFDWKIMRRTAVGAQEREEDIASPTGWLSEGHGVDLTYLATASNLDTRVNGATHMGNDDIVVFSGVAGVKIIDVACPNFLVSVMKWIMEGNRGINYVRMMRAASGVIYEPGVEFEYGKAYWVRGDENAQAVIVSSGRGVHEAIAAVELLAEKGVTAAAVDMPSRDEETLMRLVRGKAPVFFAEQNNGYIWHELGRTLTMHRGNVSLDHCHAINTNLPDGSYQYIHSGSYDQLVERFGLSAGQLAERVRNEL